MEVVKEPPPQMPEFVRHLQDQSDKGEGSNVHLEAQVNPISDHTMRIEWYKDGKSITASSRIATMFSFGHVSLHISGLRAEDAGTYVCRAVNAAGEAVSQCTIGVRVSKDLTDSTGIMEQQQYIEKVEMLERQQQSRAQGTLLNR